MPKCTLPRFDQSTQSFDLDKEWCNQRLNDEDPGYFINGSSRIEYQIYAV